MGFEDIERLREKVDKDPNLKLFIPLAEEYKKAGMYDEVPSCLSLRFFVLAEEYKKAGMFDNAIAILTKGLERQPGYLSARVSIGKIYIERGMLDEAKAEFEKVISAIPDNLYAHKKLAEIYRDLGEKDNSIKEFRTVLKLNPMDEWAETSLAEIEGAPEIQPQEQIEKKSEEISHIEKEFSKIEEAEEKPSEISIEEDMELWKSHLEAAKEGEEGEIAETVIEAEKLPEEEPLSFEDILKEPEALIEEPELAVKEKEVPKQPDIAAADQYILQGQYLEALNIYKNLLSIEPDNKHILQRVEELSSLLKLLGKGKLNNKKMKINWRWWLGLKPEIACSPLKYDYTVSVVIPAYNEEKSIADTIKSIKNQTIRIDEIIVVDDSSSDRTGEVAAGEGATVVRTPHNMGTKARAQNYVLPMIKTDLFVTIDADTILHPEAIEKTLPYFNDPKTGSVCGFVIPQKIETIWEKGRFIEYLFGISIMKAAQNNVGAVLVSSGCFSIFKTSIVNEFGGFQSRTMAEDMDLTWEMHFKSYKIYCAPDAYCYPLDPATASVFIKQVLRWYSAFFQNVSIHKRALLKNKIGLFIYGYLLDAMLTPIIIISTFTILLENFLYAFLLFIVVDLIIVSIPCLIKGLRIRMFWKTFKSVFAYPVVRFVNICVFWRALWNEWIVRKRLATWDKGH